MSFAEIIGLIAGAFTTACFIPQVIKIISTNDTKSISLGMYSMFSAGVSLWLIYGLMMKSPSIIMANAVTLPLSLIILWKKIKEKK